MNNSHPISESDLIINSDGSIYHLSLKPGEIADTVITVGDPTRVSEVSKHFDHIELEVTNREILTHTGSLSGKRISVISTGMGTDNIDIVLTELDALVNIDFQTRTVKPQLTSLDIIRIGTSGALQADVPLDSFIVSSYGFGFDVLMHFYERNLSPQEKLLEEKAAEYFGPRGISPYVAEGSKTLINRFSDIAQPGITATCAGFYGPQGRILRAQPKVHQLIETMSNFQYKKHRVTNFEMETAGIYGVGALLGHRTCSLNAIIANRAAKRFSENHHATVSKLIELALERICQ